MVDRFFESGVADIALIAWLIVSDLEKSILFQRRIIEEWNLSVEGKI
jgi:hypothetical protein